MPCGFTPSYHYVQLAHETVSDELREWTCPQSRSPYVVDDQHPWTCNVRLTEVNDEGAVVLRVCRSLVEDVSEAWVVSLADEHSMP